MKLSIDCCADGNPKQWICKVLKKKKNGKRFIGLVVGGLVGVAIVIGSNFGIAWLKELN